MRSSGGVNAEIAEPMPFIRKLAVATVRAEADRFDDNVVPSAGAPTYQEVADALNARGVRTPGQALVCCLGVQRASPLYRIDNPCRKV